METQCSRTSTCINPGVNDFSLLPREQKHDPHKLLEHTFYIKITMGLEIEKATLWTGLLL